MTTSKRKLLILLLSSFTGILLIYLISTLPFYVIVRGQIAGNRVWYIEYGDFIARGVRFAACAGLCLFVRRKWDDIGSADPVRRKAFFVVLACMAVLVLLCMSGRFDTVYRTVAYTIGIYDLDRTPMVLAILWEQIFMSDFAAGVLLGFAVLTYPKGALRKVPA